MELRFQDIEIGTVFQVVGGYTQNSYRKINHKEYKNAVVVSCVDNASYGVNSKVTIPPTTKVFPFVAKSESGQSDIEELWQIFRISSNNDSLTRLVLYSDGTGHFQVDGSKDDITFTSLKNATEQIKGRRI